MSEELYIQDLLRNLFTDEELEILQVVWNEDLKNDDKIRRLLRD